MQWLVKGYMNIVLSKKLHQCIPYLHAGVFMLIVCVAMYTGQEVWRRLY